ncbi:uncharacterized protein HGUI_01539 [Hanseniaspora guilliermondii]|uniref:Ribosome biogenesis protein SLX9 n=1 Tax=Hanseniaspora guilliermondii TaxID=56406 RepID=A0A1L0B313_9ASCO|nr:uncharacterized protein HGUI_01539 [Hanseniaspora guilliermondii]
MGIQNNNATKRKSLRSKVTTKKVASKFISKDQPSTMKPMSDIKQFLYSQNAKNTQETPNKITTLISNLTKNEMITLPNGEKVPLSSLSKSYRKRYNRKLKMAQENKLLSLDKITDELVSIKTNEEPTQMENDGLVIDHQPKLNTKKGNKTIHMNETANFKKILPTLANNNGQSNLQNIREIIKLRNQNGF